MSPRSGAGGMGEVYRAHDPRVRRDVAIKVLPESFCDDAQRRARFVREAQVLASLNHPHIGALYGVEDTAVGPVLVLELVEGVTLADHLAHTPASSIRDTLIIAQQVAAALEAAHEQGIVHRDLKPANVIVRPDGTVKVLDFGLARTLGDDATGGGVVSTLTLTGEGHGIGPGTPAYMSPERVRGGRADTRADIWAFGCVVYEQLTGQRAFGGEHVSDVAARILEREPDFGALPSGTPPLIRRLLRRCLEKDPQERLRHIGDARLDIRDALASRTDAVPPQRPRRRRTLGVGLAAVLLLALIAVWWFGPRPAPPGQPVRLTTLLPDGASVTRGPGLASAVAISPDGRTLVVAATDSTGQRLYRRPLDRLDATPLAGTERGASPFFSWDGAWIGFVADGRLKRVPSAGGAAVDIAAMPGPAAGVSWGPDDHIVFAYGGAGEMYSVSARGGNAERITSVEFAYHPDVLPDARTLLFESGSWIYALDRANGRRTRLLQGNTPRYALGHILLSRGPTLLAVPFDASRHELTGPVIPVLDGVASDASPSGSLRHYAISRSGSLAYVAAPDTFELVIVRPDSGERVLAQGQRSIENPQFSPDARFVTFAMARRSNEPPNLWVHDLQTDTATQVTFDGGRAPVWTPNGATLTYSQLAGNRGIYMKRADGRDRPAQILKLALFHWLVGWTPDQRTLVYGMMEGTPSSIMAFTGGESLRIVGPGSIWGGRLSHDGRWLTYYSRDTGNFEVYVTPVAEGGTRWRIADGTDPAWGPDGREVYYRSGPRLMAALIDSTSGFRVLSTRIVVEPFLPPMYDDYDVHPDGRTVVMVRPAGSTRAREVTMIIDWFAELRRSLTAD